MAEIRGFAGVLGRVEEHKGNSVFDPFFAGKKKKGNSQRR